MASWTLSAVSVTRVGYTEELQARSRHRVNLYATEEVVVETADEAAAAAQANAEGGGAIAQALMGLS